MRCACSAKLQLSATERALFICGANRIENPRFNFKRSPARSCLRTNNHALKRLNAFGTKFLGMIKTLCCVTACLGLLPLIVMKKSRGKPGMVHDCLLRKFLAKHLSPGRLGNVDRKSV